MPSLACVPKRSPYHLPSSTVLRVEALYSLQCSMKRHESKLVRQLLKLLRSSLMRQQYQPSGDGRRPGYFLKLEAVVAEEVGGERGTMEGREDGWPDW